MFNLDNKLEKVAGVFLIAGLVLLGSSFKSSPQKWVNAAEKIIFEIPRPTNFLAALGFDFEGREIERLFENPFAKKAAKDDARTPAAKEAAKVDKVAEAKKAAEKAKKSKLEVSVIGGDEKKASFMTDDDNLKLTQNPQPDQSQFAGPPKAAEAKPQDGADEKAKITPAQWKAMLTPPTADTLNKFLSAYMEKDVDEGTFYGILGTLLNEPKAEQQKLVLDVLAQVPQPKAFILITMSLNVITAGNQAVALDTLRSYGTIRRLGSMNTLLNFPDTAVVVKALEAFNLGYMAAYTATQNTNPPAGTVPGPTAQEVTEAYSKFLPTIRRLAQSEDAVVAQAAQQTLNQFETQVASL